MLNRIRAGGPLLWALAVLVAVRITTLGLYPLLDTTESRYAEIARKMVELNDWITPWFDYGVPFWGKPPLSFWMTAVSFKLFGINEFAARLPHFLCALLVAWLVWDWSARRSRLTQRSRQEAWYTAALLAGSAVFFIAAGAVMTDMALALGVTLTMRGFWLGLHGTDAERRRERWLVFLGLIVGLLAKGPLALVLVGIPITVWAVLTGNVAKAIRNLPWLRGGLLTIVLAVPWYVLAERHTPGFLNYFLVGEHWHRFVTPGWKGDLYGNAHASPRGSIWIFAVAACLPWALLIPIVAMLRGKVAQLASRLDPAEKSWRWFLLLWGLTPCVFFTFSGNIHWTYVLPGVPALALLGAAWLDRQSAAVRANQLLACGLMIMLLAFTGFLLNLQINGQVEARSAKSLVADYASRRTGDEALIYLRLRPYSATFYSRGKADLVPNTALLSAKLAQGPAFVAVKTNDLPNLTPALRQKLKLLAHHGDYELMHTE
jgi:4-amino-4-deoxy-L-arabinose transferase-like glycosyltransferase